MATPDLGAKKEYLGFEVKCLSSDCERIRSTWVVTSPRGSTSTNTKLLSEALIEGVDAKCDERRSSFFEADTDRAWFYFHIADKLGRIYLVAVLTR